MKGIGEEGEEEVRGIICEGKENEWDCTPPKDGGSQWLLDQRKMRGKLTARPI